MTLEKQISIYSSYSLGIMISFFCFSPSISISFNLDNIYVYYFCLFFIFFSGLLSFLYTDKKYFSILGISVFCLWIFLALIFLHSPSFFKPSQWEALLSISLCLICVHIMIKSNKNYVLKGLVAGVLISGVISSYHVIFDLDYIDARLGGNLSGRSLNYLIIALPIASALGPVLVYMKYQSGILKFLYILLFFIMAISTIFVIARASFLLAIISASLGFFYKEMELKKIKVIIFSAFFGMIFLFNAISLNFLMDVNQGLGRRFQRMLDLNNELEVGGRGAAWSKALDLFFERPFWGWNVQGVEAINGVHAHNAILEASGDLGILGGASVAAIFYFFFSSFVTAATQRSSPDSFAAHLMGFVIAMESLKSNTVYLSRVTIIFLVIIPILTKFRSIKER